MATADAVDIAIGPLRRKFTAPAHWPNMPHALHGMLMPWAAQNMQDAPAGNGAAGNAVGNGAAGVPSTAGGNSTARPEMEVEQPRPYGSEEMLQLMQVLAQHRYVPGFVLGLL